MLCSIWTRGTWTLLVLSVLVHSVAAFCCVYFIGPDFSDQPLVIRRGRENYCVLNKTTPNGFAVPCAGNATATRVNDTHVLLKTNNDTDVKFMMEYGRRGPGKNAEAISADCPDPPPVPGKVTKSDGNNRIYYGICVPVGAAIISFLIICLKYSKKTRTPNCNENCASSSNDSSTADLTDGESMIKGGQV